MGDSARFRQRALMEGRETSRKPDEVYGVIERWVSLVFLEIRDADRGAGLYRMDGSLVSFG